MEAKYISTYTDLAELQKNKVIIDNKSSCVVCNKGFFNSQIVFVYPKDVYHFDCFPGGVNS